MTLRLLGFLFWTTSLFGQVAYYRCDPSMRAIITNDSNNGAINGSTILTVANLLAVCPLRTVTIVKDVSINSTHYDWCGPTKQGLTPCGQNIERLETKLVQDKKDVEDAKLFLKAAENQKAAEAEIEDLPAVWVKKKVMTATCCPVPPPCDGKWQIEGSIQTCYQRRWSCEDTSRVLLKAEDGKGWCHKVSTRSLKDKP